MPTRKASAVWEGGLKGGKGSYNVESGSAQGSYSFESRFGEGGASNPEELLAAAEASCYSMALSGSLEKNGTPPTRVATDAVCTVEKVGDGFSITTMKLDVRASVPNIDDAKFQEIAKNTLTGCPVSKALAGGSVKLELNARLE
jgi:osmotically inducible protein OsmC